MRSTHERAGCSPELLFGLKPVQDAAQLRFKNGRDGVECLWSVERDEQDVLCRERDLEVARVCWHLHFWGVMVRVRGKEDEFLHLLRRGEQGEGSGTSGYFTRRSQPGGGIASLEAFVRGHPHCSACRSVGERGTWKGSQRWTHYYIHSFFFQASIGGRKGTKRKD